MFPRIREITDAFGSRLRISVEPRPTGALVVLELPDERGRPRALLDEYGAEMLWGYIMSARLAVPDALPDELVDGEFGALLQLRLQPAATLMVSQSGGERELGIASPFWDRLFAELCLVVAHARELSRRAVAQVH